MLQSLLIESQLSAAAVVALLLSLSQKIHEGRDTRGMIDAYVRNALIIKRPVDASGREALVQQLEHAIGLYYRPLVAVKAIDLRTKTVRWVDGLARTDPDLHARLVSALQAILLHAVEIYRQHGRPIDREAAITDVFISLAKFVRIIDDELLPAIEKKVQELEAEAR